jgi:ABC-type oligopeptide transport system substrate-binding subunit
VCAVTNNPRRRAESIEQKVHQMALNKKALHGVIALAGISALALTACTGPSGGGSSSAPAAAGPIAYGTTDKVTSLDPAGSYDNGSFMVMNQIYSFLLNSKPGELSRSRTWQSRRPSRRLPSTRSS